MIATRRHHGTHVVCDLQASSGVTLRINKCHACCLSWTAMTPCDLRAVPVRWVASRAIPLPAGCSAAQTNPRDGTLPRNR